MRLENYCYKRLTATPALPYHGGMKQHDVRAARKASSIHKWGMMCVLLGFLLSFGLAANAEETGFAFTAPDVIRSHEHFETTITSEIDGGLDLVIDYGSWQLPLLREKGIKSGVTQLPLNGLDFVGGLLPQGQATLTSTFSAIDEPIEARQAVQVRASANGISYAVLSRESLPYKGGEDLYADHQMSKPGRLLVNLYAAGDTSQPLTTWNIERKDSLPHAFRWDRTIKGQPAPAGDYVLTFEAAGSDQGIIKRPFTLTAEEALPLPLVISEAGSFLPESVDGTAVWQTLMAPIAVVDIGDLAHQKIYERPDTASPSLGVVHGQTAGLDVLALEVNGFAQVRAARQGDGQGVTGYVPQDKLKMIVPDARYGLVIDKAKQSLTVYEQGRVKGMLRVSTGVYKPPGDSWFDTVPGAFVTQDRIAEFKSEGFAYEHALRIDGGNLIHSTGYRASGRARDYAAHQAELGQMASHGCVRVDNLISGEGLNAWWLCATLPRPPKVLVLEGEPIKEMPALDDTPLIEEKPSPTPAFVPAASQPVFQVLPEEDIGDENEAIQVERSISTGPHSLNGTRIVLPFGGDSVLGSEERTRKLPESFHSIVEKNGYDWPYSGLEGIFHQDDLTLVNLENVLKDSAKGLEERMHNFRGPTEFAHILKLGGIDLVNLANNHFIDYGQDGKNSTRKALRDAGIPYAGYSSLYVFEKDGIKIGFAGIRETIFHQNRNRIADEIKELKAQGCHYIVYTCHFGIEYETNHNDLQTLMAHAAIDAGADLVIGHHPHVVQGIEQYKDGLIFYSLGNLVFGGNLELTTFDGLVAQVTLDFNQEQLTNTRVRLLPIITSGIRPANEIRPVPADGADKQRILDTVNADSAVTYPEQFELTR